MIVLEDVLSADDVAAVLEALELADFQENRASAGGASSVKYNLQLERANQEPMPLDHLIVSALTQHEAMQAYALPKTFAAPIFSQYQPGMKYNAHVDAPILKSDRPIRTDLSITLFLSDPASYDGGELVIDTDGGPKAIKLPPGNAIVYPTFALHEVKEVIRGKRVAAVTWCQSFVRDPQMRRVLFDLSAAAEAIGEQDPKSPAARLLAKSLNNLKRLVVEA